MVRHIFLFKLKADAQQGRQRAVEAIESLRSIEAAQSLEVGTDFAGTPLSYDIAAIISFADRDALAAYEADPRHREVVGLMRELSESAAVVDYDSPSPLPPT